MKVQPTTKELIAMLYERLPELFYRAAPVQEPVAWRARYHYGTDGMAKRIGDWKLHGYSPTPEEDKEIEPLYTTPPAAQRQSARSAWVGLTDEEIEPYYAANKPLIKWVEAKLKAKNFA